MLPGFHKRTDIDLQKFSVSDDGSIVTVQTFPEGSMGFIRAMEAKQFGDEIHCSFYSCFGGLNSGIGAEYRFDIQLDSKSMLSRSWLSISRWLTALHFSKRRSARVDLPWSIWAIGPCGL